MSQNYANELEFEKDFVSVLVKHGWKDGLLKNIPAHIDGKYDPNHIRSLEENFRKILDKNNMQTLHNVPLSDTEFAAVMELVNNADTPVKANRFLNDQYVSIIRDGDSPDTERAGQSVSIMIFSHQAVGTGDSVYQIAEQVGFSTKIVGQNRRGDVTLLINGLPIIHIELKKASAGIEKALDQVENYLKQDVFSGIMNTIQVFFAITPEDAVYFANYKGLQRNDTFVFRWAGKRDRQIIKDWRVLCGEGNKSLGTAMLSIPEAHQFVSCYTVAEKRKGDQDGILKVMRYYQYHAVRAILDRTMLQKWDTVDPLGGICWCTTGGGKTLSSFKAGEAIVDQGFADKVVFVVDRRELDNQTADDYNSFAKIEDRVKQTGSSKKLFDMLKSDKTSDQMIITSIQKLQNIAREDKRRWSCDLKEIQKKRVVFIIDEAQRSQFGEMHKAIKSVFPTALYFGFTGTPIMGGDSDNSMNNTKAVFGNYISIYTIADGIKDKNVLGFAPKMINTYDDSELRKAVALRQANALSEDEAFGDPKKEKVYKYFMQLPMNSEYRDENGSLCRGIESYIPNGHYNNDDHRNKVIEFIKSEWNIISTVRNKPKFHAMLSVPSVNEVISYYHCFKTSDFDVKVTALFDTNNSEDSTQTERINALDEVISDYEAMFDIKFSRDTDGIQAFKKDVMDRLAHKGTYSKLNFESNSNGTIDIVIVDEQLLVGYDSKYVNTLYLDRVLESHKLIQAISRTNRVLNEDEKPFGNVRFFRKGYTMKDNLKEALRQYCEGDNSYAEVDDVSVCIEKMNNVFEKIKNIFESDHIKNFSRLPQNNADKMKFKELFKSLKQGLNAVRLQGGFTVHSVGDDLIWDKSDDSNKDEAKAYIEDLSFDCNVYNILNMRYMDTTDRQSGTISAAGTGFAIDTYMSEVELERIDSDYLERNFRIAAPILADLATDESEKLRIIKDLTDNFGRLSALEQKHASAVLEEIKAGELSVELGKSFKAYILEHICKRRYEEVTAMSLKYGVNSERLQHLCERNPDETSLNEGMEFDSMIDSGYYANFKSKRETYESLKKFVLTEYRNI